uniref:ATP synthase F0 subunit 8 n=1 Tax=Steinernema glaseri TaxID=37863 RepID=A0A1I7YF11_9BILA
MRSEGGALYLIPRMTNYVIFISICIYILMKISLDLIIPIGTLSRAFFNFHKQLNNLSFANDIRTLVSLIKALQPLSVILKQDRLPATANRSRSEVHQKKSSFEHFAINNIKKNRRLNAITTLLLKPRNQRR